MTRKIARALGMAVLAAVVLLSAVVLALPRLTDGAALTVLSGSMEPTYPVGSMLFVRSVEPADIGVGDVITFQNSPDSPSFTTHRVVRIEPTIDGTEFVTKGDANQSEDLDPVPTGAVRGRVWFHVPWIGLARDRVATPWGLALIATLAVGVAYHDRAAAWITAWRSRHSPATQPAVAQPDVPPAAPQQPAQPPIPLATPHRPQPRADETKGPTVVAQVLLASIATTPIDRSQVLQLIQAIGGRVETISKDHVVLSVTAEASMVDGALGLLDTFNVVAVARSSVIELEPEIARLRASEGHTGAVEADRTDVVPAFTGTPTLDRTSAAPAFRGTP